MKKNEDYREDIVDCFVELLGNLDEIVVGEKREPSKWLKHGYSAPCSNCGYDTGFSNTPMEKYLKLWNFCPNCGAEMRGEE